ncbi:MAG: acyl-CoA dehydrogenase family protein, partial [Pseudomonadota bacterium]
PRLGDPALHRVALDHRAPEGRPLPRPVQGWIAEARIEIEQTRLLIQRAAWRLDREGARGAWRDVSLIKVATPRMLQTIADRAIQVFGAMGGTDDVLLHHAFAYARWFRLGDGPDEVHLRQIFRTEPAPEWSVADCPYIAPPDPPRPAEAAE